MQQTDKYQLNLIESSDTFSPAPLNENAQKLEAAIAAEAAAGAQACAAEASARVSADAAEAAARQNADTAEAATRAAADAALDQRVQVLEAHRYVVGKVTTGGFTSLGGTPQALFAAGNNGHVFVIQGQTISGVNIVEGGFQHSGYFEACRYVAFF